MSGLQLIPKPITGVFKGKINILQIFLLKF